MFYLLLTTLSAHAGSTLNVDSIAVDGLEVRALTCELDSGGLFATAVVVGALSKQKAALDACGPEGEAFKIKWSWAGSATEASVTQGSKESANDCVKAAIAAVPVALPGHCEAVVLTGPTPAAEVKWKALPTP